MRLLLLVFGLAYPAFSDSFRVGINDSLIIKAPGLKRIAVARAGMVKAVIVPPDDVIIFGKKVGNTSITLWTGKNSLTHHLQVVPYNEGEPTAGEGRLIRVVLEFIEFDRRRFEELGIRFPVRELRPQGLILRFLFFPPKD
ncbi:MAG: pilus assembly protein N-terminal domain-containing protein [Verrucomicrobiales bacterium]